MEEEKKNFAWPVTATSKEIYDYFLHSTQRISHILHEKRIVIFGAGIRGTLLSIILERQGYQNIAFCDNNSEKWGGFINQYPILPLADLQSEDGKSSCVVLVSVESGTAIVRQLELAGFILGENLFDLNMSLYDFYMEEFTRKYSNELLIIGDCGLTHISLLDQNRENLGSMLKAELGPEQTKVLAMHGMGIRAFYHVLKAQIHRGMTPKHLVLEINFDVLTGKQHLLPRSQHTELLKRISREIPGDSRELEEYIAITEQRFQNFQVEMYTKNPKRQKDSEEMLRAKARLYIQQNYMYRLKETIEPIVYLKKLMQTAKENCMVLTPFIPPVNYQLAEELLGECFLEKYQRNLDTIYNILRQESVTPVDFSFLLAKENFSSTFTADETANFAGRRKLCARLTEEVRKRSRVVNCDNG